MIALSQGGGAVYSSIIFFWGVKQRKYNKLHISIECMYKNLRAIFCLIKKKPNPPTTKNKNHISEESFLVVFTRLPEFRVSG